MVNPGLSGSQLDRLYPHQIVVSCEILRGGNYHFIHYFCEGLSVAPRGHSVVKNDEWHHVFCFRLQADAEKFQQRFGGEWFVPAMRGRGGRWHVLKQTR
jgi:hypothetical protein